jgi:hypothetical protein
MFSFYYDLSCILNYLAKTSTLVEKLPILSLLMIETVVWKSVAIFVRV